MRRGLALAIGFTACLFLVKSADLLLFIDPRTGFVKEGPFLVRIAALLLPLLVGGLFSLFERRKKRLPGLSGDGQEEGTLTASRPTGIGLLFLAAAFAVAASSAWLFLEIFAERGWNILLQVNAARGSRALFVMKAGEALLGLFAALWLLFVAACFLRESGGLTGGSLFSFLAVVWLLLRIVHSFVRHPINGQNILSVTSIFSMLLVALSCVTYAKWLSVGLLLSEWPRLLRQTVSAFVFVFGLNLPHALLFIKTTNLKMLLPLLVDVCLSAAAFFSLLSMRAAFRLSDAAEEDRTGDRP